MKNVHQTACPLDCPDTCSLDVTVERGEVTKIEAGTGNPTTQGYICSKVANFANRVYSDDRLLHPMKRVGEKGRGEFARITWEEASDHICTNLAKIREEFGGEAILPFYYGGSNGLLAQGTADTAFFAKLGASRLALTVCAAPTTEVAQNMYGKMPGTAFEDFAHAKLIVIWGANPKASNIHLVPYLKKAKAAGAKVVAVDPVCNFSDREIDLHLPVRPGTDVVVALAMIRLWQQQNLLNQDFIERHTKGIDTLLAAAQPYTIDKAAEISGIEAWKIDKLAKLYAFHDPALLRVGWGLERNRNGGASVAAVLALPAVLGKFGVRGSGYTLSNNGAYQVDSTARVKCRSWQTRVINMNLLGQTLLNENDPPIKGLFVYNCNPIATIPNQRAVVAGMSRPDLFCVVSEQVMTDTAKYADILLPAVTFLEQEEIRNGYGSYVTQYLSPAIPPRGEAKPNEEMFALLGRAMGWEDQAFEETTEDYLKRAASSIKGYGEEVTIEGLRENRVRLLSNYEPSPIQFKNVFPWTPDRKINLAPTNYEDTFYRFDPQTSSKYPLVLISPATDKSISSTLAEFNLPELFLTLNSEDAHANGLEAGDTVRVFNDLGEAIIKLKVDDHVRPGVAVLPKGAWLKASRNGWTANALSPDTLSLIGQGACFNDARVAVRRYREAK